MTIETLNDWTWAWIGLGAVTFISLFFIEAPYGRHQRKGWGPEIPSRLGWVLMETPSLLIMVAFFMTGSHQEDVAAWVFLCMWGGHYINRSWIYPFRCRTDGKTMPLSIALMAILFNGVNASINGYFLFHLAPTFGTAWLTTPWFIGGVAVFAVGMVINLHSDQILLDLRGDGTGGYKIPRGGLYRWVTCPNYLGEILEWVGFAIATYALPAVAFAVWTIANLAPRARAHDKWYREKFPDYPESRKALIPFIY